MEWWAPGIWSGCHLDIDKGSCFGHVPLEGVLRADPGTTGEITSLSCLMNASVVLLEELDNCCPGNPDKKQKMNGRTDGWMNPLVSFHIRWFTFLVWNVLVQSSSQIKAYSKLGLIPEQRRNKFSFFWHRLLRLGDLRTVGSFLGRATIRLIGGDRALNIH